MTNPSLQRMAELPKIFRVQRCPGQDCWGGPLIFWGDNSKFEDYWGAPLIFWGDNSKFEKNFRVQLPSSADWECKVK